MKHRKPKSKRVWAAYIRASDCNGMSFREFLADPDYADIRRQA